MSTETTPEDYQPRLSRWGHVWRTAAMLFISVAVLLDSYAGTWREHPWRLATDVALGLVAYVVVHFRRRRPLTITAVVLVLSIVSGVAAGPALLATVSVATRRVYWQVVVLVVTNTAAAQAYWYITPSNSPDSLWVTFTGNLAASGALVAWGMFIGSRRELLWTLRQRAERAEGEQDLRVGKARAEERARIAREMHDVLAHRISQVSMHAGALAFRSDLDADALRSGIGDVQVKANAALTDLRSVLGVLRDRETGELANRPQPTYDDVQVLVSESRSAGARVWIDDLLAGRLDGEVVPEQLGRTIYRVVQEGITNAHKHARGALLTIRLAGSVEDGVEVLLRNPLGFGESAAPGSGLGLIGLRERVELAGGRFVATKDGSTFVVRAWLPWTP